MFLISKICLFSQKRISTTMIKYYHIKIFFLILISLSHLFASIVTIEGRIEFESLTNEDGLSLQEEKLENIFISIGKSSVFLSEKKSIFKVDYKKNKLNKIPITVWAIDSLFGNFSIKTNVLKSNLDEELIINIGAQSKRNSFLKAPFDKPNKLLIIDDFDFNNTNLLDFSINQKKKKLPDWIYKLWEIISILNEEYELNGSSPYITIEGYCSADEGDGTVLSKKRLGLTRARTIKYFIINNFNLSKEFFFILKGIVPKGNSRLTGKKSSKSRFVRVRFYSQIYIN